jgi:hypothetical protein
MWFKKNSKWVHFYMLWLLIFYLFLVLIQSVYTVPWKHPWNIGCCVSKNIVNAIYLFNIFTKEGQGWRLSKKSSRFTTFTHWIVVLTYVFENPIWNHLLGVPTWKNMALQNFGYLVCHILVHDDNSHHRELASLAHELVCWLFAFFGMLWLFHRTLCWTTKVSDAYHVVL